MNKPGCLLVCVCLLLVRAKAKMVCVFIYRGHVTVATVTGISAGESALSDAAVEALGAITPGCAVLVLDDADTSVQHKHRLAVTCWKGEKSLDLGSSAWRVGEGDALWVRKAASGQWRVRCTSETSRPT